MKLNLEDYETRMVYDGKRNNREVKIVCEQCGKVSWQRWQRVKQKVRDECSFFCSIDCANLFRRRYGKENVYFYFDKLKGRHIARWKTKDDKFHVMHKARFVWEREYGEIPDGYDIHHKDGDVCNDDLSNLEMVEGSLHKQGIHGSNRKVVDGVVYKECFRCKKFYPETSFNTSYCRSCQTEYMREYRSR